MTGAIGYNTGQSIANSFLTSGNIITPFEGAIATGMEFGIGAIGPGMASGFAGGKGNIGDIFTGGAIGFAGGFVIGGAVGYSYTAGWQNFIHGVGTVTKNSIREGLREAMALRCNGDLQKAYDLELSLAKKYGLAEVVGGKAEYTKALQGKFVKNKPADFLVTETSTGKELGRAVINPRDGLPNFKEGRFYRFTVQNSINPAQNVPTMQMFSTTASYKLYATNLPIGYNRVSSWTDFFTSASVKSEADIFTLSTNVESFKGRIVE